MLVVDGGGNVKQDVLALCCPAIASSAFLFLLALFTSASSVIIEPALIEIGKTALITSSTIGLILKLKPSNPPPN